MSLFLNVPYVTVYKLLNSPRLFFTFYFGEGVFNAQNIPLVTALYALEYFHRLFDFFRLSCSCSESLAGVY